MNASPEGLNRLNAAKARLGLTNAAIAEQKDSPKTKANPILLNYRAAL